MTLLSWCFEGGFGTMSPMERVAQLHQLLNEMNTETLSFASVEAAAEYAGLVEQATRKLDAHSIAVVAEVDRTGVYTVDGFGSVNGWTALVCRTTRVEAKRRAGLADMFRSLPECAEAYRAGQLGREQLSCLLTAFSNPRCGHLLAESLTMLLEDERSLFAREFAVVMKHWTRLADADGARRRSQTNHQFRDVRIFENFDGGYTLDGSFGALQGATIKSLFDRFIGTERMADWEAARLIHGDKTRLIDLARTEAQRRADAMEAALTQAAGAGFDVNLPEPSVTIVMSPDAFEQGIAALTDTEAPAADATGYRDFRCETLGGTQLDPADAVAAAIKGHMRRVIYTTPEASVSCRRLGACAL